VDVLGDVFNGEVLELRDFGCPGTAGGCHVEGGVRYVDDLKLVEMRVHVSEEQGTPKTVN
jgi:hypothetical protein